jgi:hypothetical protein
MFYKKVLQTLKTSQIKPEIGNSSWDLLRPRPPCRPPLPRSPGAQRRRDHCRASNPSPRPRAARIAAENPCDASNSMLRSARWRRGRAKPRRQSPTGAGEKGRSAPFLLWYRSPFPFPSMMGARRRATEDRASLRTSSSQPPPGPCTYSSADQGQRSASAEHKPDMADALRSSSTLRSALCRFDWNSFSFRFTETVSVWSYLDLQTVIQSHAITARSCKKYAKISCS